MDSRLLDAAWNGNVETLVKLIEEDRRILHTTALTEGETPLHTAALAGHLHFVKELVNVMPSFAWELNPDGFSPLHIASAKGYVEVVRELLRIDENLCLVEGMDNRIPLHCAVIKGRLEVVRKLISVNSDSIGNVTARGETALHLALKNNQFKAFRVLVEHLKQVNKEHFLSMKDDQGNTILHLAASRKLYQVIRLLLDEKVIIKGTMDLNSTNNRGLTPLDVLKLSQSKAGDQELEDLLRQAGGEGTENSGPPTNIVNDEIQLSSTINGIQSIPRLATQPSQRGGYFNYHKLEDSTPGDITNFMLVISTLILTATYQALLSPPGGFWQDESNGVAGVSIMATKQPTGYKIYVAFNTFGFIMSMNMICALIAGFPMIFELLFSMFALFVTYVVTLHAISAESPAHFVYLALIICAAICVWRVFKNVYSGDRKSRRNALSGINDEAESV